MLDSLSRKSDRASNLDSSGDKKIQSTSMSEYKESMQGRLDDILKGMDKNKEGDILPPNASEFRDKYHGKITFLGKNVMIAREKGIGSGTIDFTKAGLFYDHLSNEKRDIPIFKKITGILTGQRIYTALEVLKQYADITSENQYDAKDKIGHLLNSLMEISKKNKDGEEIKIKSSISRAIEDGDLTRASDLLRNAVISKINEWKY